MPQRPLQQFITYDSCLVIDHFCFSALPFLVCFQHVVHLNFTERRTINVFQSKLLRKLVFKGFVLKEACFLIPVCRKKTEMASYHGFLCIFRKHSKIHSIRSLTAQPSEQHTEVPKQVSDFDKPLNHAF